MFRTLHAEEILRTAANLRDRVRARFPSSNLLHVSEEVQTVAREARERCRTIQRPNVALRVSVLAIIVLGVVGIAGVVIAKVRLEASFWEFQNFAASAEALIGDLVFLGAAVAFLVTLETRIKRKRALTAVNELRALAHIVDMHQLTKDPEMVLSRHPRTEVSPDRGMTPFELNRYLDYCSEMLALISKIGALYVQSFPDPQALTAVDEIENLTTGLSRKIWQKIMILDHYVPRTAERRIGTGS